MAVNCPLQGTHVGAAERGCWASSWRGMKLIADAEGVILGPVGEPNHKPGEEIV
jgi:hypothetical protein